MASYNIGLMVWQYWPESNHDLHYYIRWLTNFSYRIFSDIGYDGVTYVKESVVLYILFGSHGLTWTKYLVWYLIMWFPLPTISFIIFHDFAKFVLLNSNCSSMYSFSLFLRSEVNISLNVVHSKSQCCSEIR